MDRYNFKSIEEKWQKFWDKNKTFKSKKDILIAKKMGIKDLNKKYDIKEIIKGESLFCATGITDGDLVKGVLQHQNKFFTETLVTHKNNSINIVKNKIANT